MPTSLSKGNTLRLKVIMKPFFDTHPASPVGIIACNGFGGFIGGMTQRVFRCFLYFETERFAFNLSQSGAFK